MNQETLSKDQLDAMQVDYLYELANNTGFGAPKMWNKDRPRNFREYVRLKCGEAASARIGKDFDTAFAIVKGAPPPSHECMFHTRYWTTSQDNVTVDWRECSHCRIRYRKFFPDGKWHLAPIQPA